MTDQERQALKSGCCGHASDCAVHNAPALPPGPCNCGYVTTGPESSRYIPRDIPPGVLLGTFGATDSADTIKGFFFFEGASFSRLPDRLVKIYSADDQEIASFEVWPRMCVLDTRHLPKTVFDPADFGVPTHFLQSTCLNYALNEIDDWDRLSREG